MARSDIYRNFWSGGRFGVRVGTQELGGLSGWTCTELELTQLPLTLQSHFCPPKFLNKGIFTTWRIKNNQKIHKCITWSNWARSHLPGLMGLPKNQHCSEHVARQRQR